MADGYGRIGRALILGSVSLVVGLVFGQYVFPIIFKLADKPGSPSKALQAILTHRTELKTLEAELTQALQVPTINPFHLIGIPKAKAIGCQLDELIAQVQDYSQNNGGKVEVWDLDRFTERYMEIRFSMEDLKWQCIKQQYEEVTEESRSFHYGLSGRAQTAAQWTRVLSKNMETTAWYGIILDAYKEEGKDLIEIDQREADEASVRAMMELLNLLTAAGSLSEKTEEIALLYEAKKEVLGKVGYFITGATQRVKRLDDKHLAKFHKEGALFMAEFKVLHAVNEAQAERVSYLIQEKEYDVKRSSRWSQICWPNYVNIVTEFTASINS